MILMSKLANAISVQNKTYNNSTTKRIGNKKMTVSIKHNLAFVTEVDETHPVGMQLLRLSESMQIVMLESMLKDLLAPRIQPALDEINANGSYAILKVAN
jgi:hypothetical protein